MSATNNDLAEDSSTYATLEKLIEDWPEWKKNAVGHVACERFD